MNERRNVPEIVIVICELLRRSQTRINLLFTMSEIPHAHPVKDATCEVMFRGRCLWPQWSARLRSFELRRGSLRYDRACRAEAGTASEGWWSQTGSNRRPHACKARALPAELWPRTRRRMLYVALIVRSPSLALRRSSLRSRRPAEPKLQSSEGWWAWEDLNFRPHAYQARALTN
jgi:hypothetical protein